MHRQLTTSGPAPRFLGHRPRFQLHLNRYAMEHGSQRDLQADPGTPTLPNYQRRWMLRWLMLRIPHTSSLDIARRSFGGGFPAHCEAVALLALRARQWCFQRVIESLCVYYGPPRDGCKRKASQIKHYMVASPAHAPSGRTRRNFGILPFAQMTSMSTSPFGSGCPGRFA
jgi:hypothetical protein